MANPQRWLHEELPGWVRDGVVTTAQAEQLRARYPLPVGRAWGVIIFGSLGAIVVGLGVILMLAYNWAELSKGAKLALIFGSLLAAHGSGLWLHQTRPGWRGIGEGLTVLGTMLFGAGIWLIAQLYHIHEHFPNGFLFWGLGAFALAWAMPSLVQAAMGCLLLTIWSSTESVAFQAPMIAGPWLTLLLAGPLAWRHRSRLLLGLLLPCVVTSFVLGAAVHQGEVAAALLLSLGAALVAGAFLLERHTAFPTAAPLLRGYGYALYFALLYLLTFGDIAEELLDDNHRMGQGMVPTVLRLATAGLALVLWVWAAWPWWRDRARMLASRTWFYLLMPLSVLAATLFWWGGGGDDWLTAGPFALIFLAHASSLMAEGCLQGRLGPTIWGAVLLCLLALARYFDLFDNLFARGLVFVLVGGVLFAEGILYARAKARAKAEEPQCAAQP